jgi:hypothetical protein
VVAGVHGEVQADSEQLGLPAGQRRGQITGVVGRGRSLEVLQPAVFGVGAGRGFQPGQLAAEPVGGDGRRGRLDMHRHLQSPWVGQQWLQPAGTDLGGIAGDGERGTDPLAQAQGAGTHLDGVGAEPARRLLRLATSAWAATREATSGEVPLLMKILRWM